MECVDCGNDRIEANGLCATCAARRRKESRLDAQNALKKKSVLKRPQKPIKKRSDKRAIEEAIYNKLVAVWKKGKKCGVSGCGKDCEECHHMAGRDAALLLDTSKWLPVCREHHTQITTDSAWAIENEYSLPRNHR